MENDPEVFGMGDRVKMGSLTGRGGDRGQGNRGRKYEFFHGSIEFEG